MVSSCELKSSLILSALASLVAQTVKNLPTMQEIGVRSLGWENPLEEEITHTSILAWRILWTEEPVGYSPWSSLGQNTAVGSFSLLQGIFPTQGSNSGLLHRRQILYHLSPQGSPS